MRYYPILLALLVVPLLLACQPAISPLRINDVPVYPGAVELEPDELTGDAQVQEWLKRDAAERGTPIDAIAYKHFRLPKDLTNPNPMSFYSDALSKMGWSARWGSVPARQAFTRGSQYLVLYIFTNQTGGETELLMTLNQ